MSNIITNLNSATFWMNRYIPPLLIVFGTFGNLMNLIIFTRRTLRSNPCSMYFLAGSINNLFAADVGILSRYLSISWNLDITTTNTILCKLRLFLINLSFTLVLWYTILASIDRFFSSSKSVRLRQLSSLSVARKNIVFMTIFMFLIHAHILVFGRSDVSGITMTCGFFSDVYNIFFTFFFLIIASILPLILMCVFGILIILNVRGVHNRVAPQINDAQTERFRSNDRQLFIMLLFQLLITALLTTPYATVIVYNVISTTILNYKRSTFEQAIYNLVLNLTRLLSYSNGIVGFYIYTLSGSKFRVEVKRCIQYAWKSTLTAMGLIRYLPMRAQLVVAGEIQMGANHEPVARGTGNTVQPIQHKTTTNKTSAM